MPRRQEREARLNLILASSIGALALLTVIVVSCSALAPKPAQPAASDSTQSVSDSVPPTTTKTKHVTSTEPSKTSTPKTTAASDTTPAKPSTTTAAKPPAPAAKTIPDEMSHLIAGSTQLIVVTGKSIGSTSGTLRIFDKDAGSWHQVLATPANFGKTGLVDGETRVSGHLNTPTGIWHIGSFLFGQHASPPAGTKMPYRQIKSTSYWSGEHNSTYNTWVDHKVDGEHLQDARVQYEYAFDSGYNAPPNERVIGRGTAIFIHCFEPAGNALGVNTHGCVAIDPSVMQQVFTMLDPARNPTCAIGTEKRGTSTSIWAY